MKINQIDRVALESMNAKILPWFVSIEKFIACAIIKQKSHWYLQANENESSRQCCEVVCVNLAKIAAKKRCHTNCVNLVSFGKFDLKTYKADDLTTNEFQSNGTHIESDTSS